MESFGHEKLNVYKKALSFVKWVEANTKNVPKTLPVRKHLEEASTSIVLNIAEGNGKYTTRDKCKFLDIAKGSTLECAACIDILLIKKYKISDVKGKEILKEIFSMLVGLIKSTSSNRIYDDLAVYENEIEN